MRINLTVETESIGNLLRILRAGTTLSGLTCTVLPDSIKSDHPEPAAPPPYVYDVKTVSDLGPNAAHRERLVTNDYWRAPAGEGPQAATWKDKPHRLVYDLVGEVEFLRARLLPESP
jgi:hypothetical protein